MNDLVRVGHHLAQSGAALAPGEDARVVVERVEQPEPDGERPGRGVDWVQVGPGVGFGGGSRARVPLEDQAVF